MNSWICIVNRENWEIVKNKNIWGVSEKNKYILSRVMKGDKLVFYITQEGILAGIFEAVSVIFEDNSRLFESDKGELFTYRIKIAPLKISKPIKIIYLISVLEFIINKKSWGTYFFGRAMRSLSKKDYLIIESNMN